MSDIMLQNILQWLQHRNWNDAPLQFQRGQYRGFGIVTCYQRDLCLQVSLSYRHHPTMSVLDAPLALPPTYK